MRAGELRAGDACSGAPVLDVEPVEAVCSLHPGAEPEPAVKVTFKGGSWNVLPVDVDVDVRERAAAGAPLSGSRSSGGYPSPGRRDGPRSPRPA